MTTGQRACWVTWPATEPTISLVKPPAPREPRTSMAGGAGESKYVAGPVSGVAVPVAAQGGSQLACPLVGEEYARAVDLDDLVSAGNGVA